LRCSRTQYPSFFFLFPLTLLLFFALCFDGGFFARELLPLLSSLKRAFPSPPSFSQEGPLLLFHRLDFPLEAQLPLLFLPTFFSLETLSTCESYFFSFFLGLFFPLINVDFFFFLVSNFFFPPPERRLFPSTEFRGLVGDLTSPPLSLLIHG